MDDPSDPNAETDDRLLLRSREGDRHAFSELWRRHSPIAVAYARSLGTAPQDPEDVVSDAFVSILHLLRAGRGPERSFRPYLLTTVRNVWMSGARKMPPTTPIDDAEHPASAIGAIDIDAMADSSTISEAFSSLPERWQHALWLSEVEQLPPRQIATVLHIRPNSAAALTYRARDALRKAWIRAHLRSAPEGTDHARVIEMLGAYAHGDLAPTSESFVTAHLDDCDACASAAGEARHLARAMTLGPLLAGGTGLVLSPLLFPAEQAAAAVVAMTDAPNWAGLSLAAQPAVEAASHATPALWHVAAAAAVALTVGGGVLALPVAEPAAIAPTTIATPAPAGAVPGPAPATNEAEEASAPDPRTTPGAAVPPGSGTHGRHGDDGRTGGKRDDDRSGPRGNGNNGHGWNGNGGNGKNGNGNNRNGNSGNGNGGNGNNGNGNGDNGHGTEADLVLSSAPSAVTTAPSRAEDAVDGRGNAGTAGRGSGNADRGNGNGGNPNENAAHGNGNGGNANAGRGDGNGAGNHGHGADGRGQSGKG